MTLKEARAVQKELHARGLWCVVPLGYGPDKYFARIQAADYIDFYSRRAARNYLAKRLIKRRQEERLRRMPPPRNALELMIDRACGLR